MLPVGVEWAATPAQAQAKLVDDDKTWAEYIKIAKIEPQG